MYCLDMVSWNPCPTTSPPFYRVHKARYRLNSNLYRLDQMPISNHLNGQSMYLFAVERPRVLMHMFVHICRDRVKSIQKSDPSRTQEVILMAPSTPPSSNIQTLDPKQLQLYEGMSSNFFVVYQSKQDPSKWILKTAPKQHVLLGTVAQLIETLMMDASSSVEWLEGQSVELVYEHPTLSDFLDQSNFDVRACFISSTSRLIMPVNRILVILKDSEQTRPGNGEVNPLVLEMKSDTCSFLLQLQSQVQMAIQREPFCRHILE